MILSLHFLFISLIASLIHLDVLVFGEFMFHRPIVVGPIIGFLSGDPNSGILIGLIFELFYLSFSAIGVEIPPDATSSTVFAVVVYKFISKCMPISIVFGLIVGILYKYMDIYTRSINSMLLSWVDTAKNEFLIRRINLLVVYGLFTTYFKTLLFYLLTFPLLGYVVFKLCEFGSNTNLIPNNPEFFHILPSIGIGIGLSSFINKK